MTSACSLIIAYSYRCKHILAMAIGIHMLRSHMRVLSCTCCTCNMSCLKTYTCTHPVQWRIDHPVLICIHPVHMSIHITHIALELHTCMHTPVLKPYASCICLYAAHYPIHTHRAYICTHAAYISLIHVHNVACICCTCTYT